MANSLSAQFKMPRQNATTRKQTLFGRVDGTENDQQTQQQQESQMDQVDITSEDTADEESLSFDDEVNQAIVQQTNEFISEFGEQLFKLTVNQWLTKREKKTRSSVGTPRKTTKKSSSGSEQPSKKRRRS